MTEEVGIPLWWIGLAWAVGYVLTAVSSLWWPRHNAKLESPSVELGGYRGFPTIALTYSYHFHGKQFFGNRYRFGGVVFESREDAEKVLKALEEQTPFTVAVCPLFAGTATVVPGISPWIVALISVFLAGVRRSLSG